MERFNSRVWKARAFAAVAVLVAAVGIGSAARYVTNFSKIQLDQNAILDSTGTQRLSVGGTNAVTGNVTVSGTIDVAGSSTFVLPTVTTQTASGTYAGMLARNASNEVYIATSTTVAGWVKVGAQ